jgi:hypothetical protein
VASGLEFDDLEPAFIWLPSFPLPLGVGVWPFCVGEGGIADFWKSGEGNAEEGMAYRGYPRQKFLHYLTAEGFPLPQCRVYRLWLSASLGARWTISDRHSVG